MSKSFHFKRTQQNESPEHLQIPNCIETFSSGTYSIYQISVQGPLTSNFLPYDTIEPQGYFSPPTLSRVPDTEYKQLCWHTLPRHPMSGRWSRAVMCRQPWSKLIYLVHLHKLDYLLTNLLGKSSKKGVHHFQTGKKDSLKVPPPEPIQ